MNKSNEMKQLLATLVRESKALMNKEGVTSDELNAKSKEIDDLQAKITIQEKIEEQEKLKNKGNPVVGNPTTSTEDDLTDENYNTDLLLNMLLSPSALNNKEKSLAEIHKLTVSNALSSNTNADGGYLIPEDQRVAINEFKRTFQSLEPLVSVEKVGTLSGNRNYEVEAEYTSFPELIEGEKIADTDTPTFKNMTYKIKDFGGILTVPADLLADNKAGLSSYLNKWLAKKDVATRNALIRNVLDTWDKTPIVDVDDVKDIMNVQLDAAVAAGASIVMNQDAFNKFDKMKDNDGNYLLQPDPKNPTQLLLKGKPVKVYSNKILKTRTDVDKKLAPVLIGDMKEAILIYDRMQTSLLSTNIGAGGFEYNQTKIRAIFRLDVEKIDTDALVFGEINVA